MLSEHIQQNYKGGHCKGTL